MALLQDDEFLEMSWDEGANSVVTRWKKLCMSYEEQLASLVILLVEHEGSRWIDDTNGSGVFMPSYNRWLRETLLPLLVAAGLKRFAFVLPDYFGSEQAEGTTEDFAVVEGLEAKAFNRHAHAAGWIQTS